MLLDDETIALLGWSVSDGKPLSRIEATEHLNDGLRSSLHWGPPAYTPRPRKPKPAPLPQEPKFDGRHRRNWRHRRKDP